MIRGKEADERFIVRNDGQGTGSLKPLRIAYNEFQTSVHWNAKCSVAGRKSINYSTNRCILIVATSTAFAGLLIDQAMSEPTVS